MAQQREAVVVAQDVDYVYTYPNRPPVHALKGANFTIHKGERWVVVGENGSGKTTLLAALGGLRKTTGNLTIYGRNAFEDLSLTGDVALLAEAWSDEVGWAQTVENTLNVSPKFDRKRFLHLCNTLHVDPTWRVDHCSSGMKRRVQIVMGLMDPKTVLLLDEITPDLDEAERAHILGYLKTQTESHGATVLYCTHIFDQLDDWPTHIMFMANGQVQAIKTRAEIQERLQTCVYNWIKGNTNRQWLEDGVQADPSSPPMSPLTPTVSEIPADNSAVIEVNDLTFHYGKDSRFTQRVRVFDNLSLSLPKGARALLIGTNGSGKSTLLRLMAGVHFMASEKVIRMLGRPAFHDTALHSVVGFSGSWWKATDWNLSLADLINGLYGLPHDSPPPLDHRAQQLLRVLDADLEWRLHSASFGQRVRMKLFLNMMTYRPVLLLDEVTAYLDLVQRIEFIKWIHRESVERGCTILYSTHIFEGLEGWPTHLVILDGLKQNLHAIVELPAQAEANAPPLCDRIMTVMRSLKEAEWAAITEKITKISGAQSG